MSNTELNCKGPCISHCYYKYSIIFILIGILIGYALTEVMKKRQSLAKEKVI
jgi:hypothetical protein